MPKIFKKNYTEYIFEKGTYCGDLSFEMNKS